ncbi:MAG: ABC transporter ATP-binding protein [Phycisphaerae bacterium]|nr:ABC transporter ATP-binding protein [Phycisphaerae bacterium]
MGPQWDIQTLSFAYKGQGVLIDQLSFSLAAGTFTGVAGPNGVGKTTLIHLLSGTLNPSEGKILLEGQSVHGMSPASLARRLALVRQHTDMSFGFTVEETVLMARTAHLDWRGFESTVDRDRVHEALCLTETDHLAHRSINSLSGGECQRVFIARALAQDTDVLILDEPTNHLDLKHQIAVYDLLKSIQVDQGKTIITITHDINMAMQYCDQVLLLSPGYDQKSVIGPPQDVLTCDRIEAVFGVRVMRLTHNEHTFIAPIGQCR